MRISPSVIRSACYEPYGVYIRQRFTRWCMLRFAFLLVRPKGVSALFAEFGPGCPLNTLEYQFSPSDDPTLSQLKAHRLVETATPKSGLA